ncbi:MAG: DUF3795 domain-containing protein [Methanosarcinaceae archaeon]|nr:DUF3795 domain-containing protein [Methanosarcinaceae archaeon]
MLSQNITILHIIFVSISLVGGLAAMYFWIRLYFETKKGSIAWLLLALTSVFIVSTSIFPSLSISLQDPDVTDIVLTLLGLWSAVYTSLFAIAGLLLFQAFRNIPRETLGDFLIDGMVFNRPPDVKSSCGRNCHMCQLYRTKDCMGCMAENKYSDEKCPIYMCVNEKGIQSCWDCDERNECDRYDQFVEVSPVRHDTQDVSEVEDVSNLLKRSTLIEYTPYTRYEDSVIEICLRLYGEMTNVVLISTEPRTSFFRNCLGDLIDVGAMKFIELSTTSHELVEDNGVIKLPFDDINKLFDMTSKLPDGCAIIFEPLSHMILEQGSENTYKFVSGMVEEFSDRFLLVSLINRKAHDEQTLSRFEGLFLNLAEEIGNRIRVTKGGNQEYIRFFAGEKFYMEQGTDVSDDDPDSNTESRGE